MNKWTIEVTVEVSDIITKEEITEYVEYAVMAWKGGFMPDDPIHSLNRETVKVRATSCKKSL